MLRVKIRIPEVGVQPEAGPGGCRKCGCGSWWSMGRAFGTGARPGGRSWPSRSRRGGLSTGVEVIGSRDLRELPECGLGFGVGASGLCLPLDAVGFVGAAGGERACLAPEGLGGDGGRAAGAIHESPLLWRSGKRGPPERLRLLARPSRLWQEWIPRKGLPTTGIRAEQSIGRLKLRASTTRGLKTREGVETTFWLTQAIAGLAGGLA